MAVKKKGRSRMLIEPECIPCILNISLRVARKVTDDRIETEKLFNKAMKIGASRGLNVNVTTPEIAEIIFLEALGMTSNKDPFSEVKEEQNNLAWELYPWAKQLIERAQDPFTMALRLSLAGNLLDSVIGTDVLSLRQELKKILDKDLPSKEVGTFRKKIESSRLILYLGDNAGEIIFDRLFIKTIKEIAEVDVIFVVRSVPTYNDVTLKEASAVGMDRYARVIANGISGPLPGTILPRCSAEMREICDRADLIISKGGGNLETLAMGSPWSIPKDITFLTIAKCLPQCLYFGVNLYDPILKNVYNNGSSLG